MSSCSLRSRSRSRSPQGGEDIIIDPTSNDEVMVHDDTSPREPREPAASEAPMAASGSSNSRPSTRTREENGHQHELESPHSSTNTNGGRRSPVPRVPNINHDYLELRRHASQIIAPTYSDSEPRNLSVARLTADPPIMPPSLYNPYHLFAHYPPSDPTFQILLSMGYHPRHLLPLPDFRRDPRPSSPTSPSRTSSSPRLPLYQPRVDPSLPNQSSVAPIH